MILNIQLYVLLSYCAIDILLYIIKALLLIAVYLYFKIYGGLKVQEEQQSRSVSSRVETLNE